MTETKKNPIGQFIENTLVPISTAFAQNRYVRCIGTGSQNLMAIIMIGAVFNLLNSIQIDPYQSFIQATGIAAFLNAVYNACMNFMGVFMVFSVGYAGANAYERMVSAFEAEARGDATPRWPPSQSLRFAHLTAALHRTTDGSDDGW